MFTLAAGKAVTGKALDNPVLRKEGKVTAVDGILAVAVLLGSPSTLRSAGGGRTQPLPMSSSTTRQEKPGR